MSKYKHANAAIERAISEGCAEGLEKGEILLALIVASVSAYRSEAGKGATRDALLYELGEVEGVTDTQFIRSR